MNILVPAVVSSFLFSFFGAYLVSLFDNETLKPLFMVILFVVFLLTIRNKSFGTIMHEEVKEVEMWKPILIGALLGFYDGFFGPGTGSFLIIAFVGVMGMTFVQGAGYSKVVNLTTNIAAILMFSFKTNVLFQYALPMMIFNVGGSLVGVRMALLKGNEFVRVLLRGIVFATIVKMAFDIYRDYY